MPIYSVFDFCLESQVPLPALVEVDCCPDVTLKLSKINHLSPHKKSLKYFQGNINNLLCFRVQEGKEIRIAPYEDVDLNLIQSAIYGPIFSILLRQRGLLVLHGSCIVINNFAIAFLGSSRAGKSTLAEAFYQKKFPVVTDDVLAIHFNSANPLVVPSIPRIKLWPDSALACGHQLKQLPSIYPDSDKRYHSTNNTSGDVPLAGIYILSQGPQLRIDPQKPRQGFLNLVKHSRGKVLQDPNFREKHFEQCINLLQAVPVYSLTRPLALSKVWSLVDSIVDHHVQTNTHSLSVV